MISHVEILIGSQERAILQDSMASGRENFKCTKMDLDWQQADPCPSFKFDMKLVDEDFME